MSIIDYKLFEQSLNKTLFENSYSDLFHRFAEKPERYIGLFRPTKPKTKIIQNVTQSHEIRFGDALENIFEVYFKALGFTIEYADKHFTTPDGTKYDIDQLFSKDGVLYMIEQKVRDDHDSTKKRGQFDNFEAKYFELTRRCGNRFSKIIPIMWFIDASLVKNRKYYLERMTAMEHDYECKPRLFYGEAMFWQVSNDGIRELPYAMWDEIIGFLKQWKETLPDMPEVNFDMNANDVFAELKVLPPNIFKKILQDDEIIRQIFPIIFPEKKVLDLLYQYFSKQYEPIYRTLKSLVLQAKSSY